MPTRSTAEFTPGKGVAVGPVIILGPPGAGKGTQAKLMAERYKIAHISTGDILRENVARVTELGKKAKSIMDRGELVPDDLVCDMVAARLAQPDCDLGFILDGFPRTIRQAAWLDEVLEKRSFAGRHLLPIVINVRVEYNQLLRRLTGRRICPTCGRTYNIYFQPPRREGFCDLDGAPLIQRKDDSEEVISERLSTYERQTMPLVDYYRKQGRVHDLDGSQAVEKVTAGMINLVEKLRAGDD